MNIIKSIALSIVRSAVLAAVNEALDLTMKEVNEEFDKVKDDNNRATLKSAAMLVDVKARAIVKSKLDNLTK